MNSLFDFFFPRHCILCGTRHRLLPESNLCQPCKADFSLNLNCCGHCAVPMNEADNPLQQSLCGQCLISPPEFDYCWSPFVYGQPLEWGIQQLKFNARLMFAPLLSELMIQQIPAHLLAQQKADAIIPMPLHPARLKQRGFNQSLLLVKPLARKLGIKIDSQSCQRLKNTEHQTGKNARQRKQNLRSAFKFDNRNNYRHLVIFDDVVTTGSSVSELSKTLKSSGVDRVDVWCLARAEKYK